MEQKECSGVNHSEAPVHVISSSVALLTLQLKVLQHCLLRIYYPFQRVAASGRNMDHGNTSHTPVDSYVSLFNCIVSTNYRFVFYQVSYSIIFLVGLVTNTLALRRLCQVSHNSLNSTAIYILSLSVADMLFVVSLPLRIYYHHQKAQSLSAKAIWTPGAAFCQLTFTLKYISLYGSIFFLVCIAVDRYFAVVHPLCSSMQRRRVAQLLTSLIWSLVLGLSLGLLLLRSAAAHQHEPCLLDPSSPQHRTIILVALGLVQGTFVLPTGLLLFSYCRVLSVLRQPRHQGHNQRRKHTLNIIYWVLAVFLSCFVPYHINLLGYTFTHVGLLSNCALTRITKTVHPVALTVASFNCCLNPLIYYFSRTLVHRQPSSGGSGSQ